MNETEAILKVFDSLSEPGEDYGMYLIAENIEKECKYSRQEIEKQNIEFFSNYTIDGKSWQDVYHIEVDGKKAVAKKRFKLFCKPKPSSKKEPLEYEGHREYHLVLENNAWKICGVYELD